MHDPLNVGDLVEYEYRQLRESGFDVSGIQAASAAIPAGDLQRLESTYLELTRTVRAPGWRYQEPNQLPDILAAMPARSTADPARAVPDGLADRILGGWLGRIAGCNLGKPVEDGAFWTAARLRTYLELAGAYPLRDYVPALDPMPEGFRLRECWPETTRGLVRGSARDDDIDYSILALWLVEQHGFELTTGQVADALLAYLPYARVFTAERTALVNLLHNVPIAKVGETRNPYREWIGAQIRADVFGWVLPGRPGTAAELVFRDAFLTHRGNGIYAAMWAAALVSIACVSRTVSGAFEESLDYVPAQSRLAEALRAVQDLHRACLSWDEALETIQTRFGDYSWVHSINNACLVAAGLLWGEGDFSTTVGLTVQGGWDTDSNAATAGSVVGTVTGAAKLPRHFIEPLEDRTRSAVFGYDNSRISDLARRTVRLAEFGLRPHALTHVSGNP